MTTPEPSPPYGPPQPYGPPHPSQPYPSQPYGHPAPQGAYGPYIPEPMQMPRAARTTRILLFVIGGLYALVGPVLITVAAAVDDLGKADVSRAALYATGTFTLAVGVVAVVVAALFRKGGNGVRVTAMVIGWIMIANAVIALTAGQAGFMAGFVSGILIVSNCLKKDTVAWFGRPRG
ncbi:hypothetical protein [Streptomyces blastmyceticus]|uniref:Integral membrane protein n=1 Tax=Streptomyces blastmyceticus TaxID=68180 RepID=A0ABN0X134_9ACTN